MDKTKVSVENNRAKARTRRTAYWVQGMDVSGLQRQEIAHTPISMMLTRTAITTTVLTATITTTATTATSATTSTVARY